MYFKKQKNLKLINKTNDYEIYFYNKLQKYILVYFSSSEFIEPLCWYFNNFDNLQEVVQILLKDEKEEKI